MSGTDEEERDVRFRAGVIPRLTHEGRNALQEFQAGLRLVRLVLRDHGEAVEILDDLAKPASRLERLFGDLEEYSRPLQVALETCDAAAAWRAACARLPAAPGEGRFGEAQVEKRCLVRADPMLLEETLSRTIECLVGRSPDPEWIGVHSADVEVEGKRMVRITMHDSRHRGANPQAGTIQSLPRDDRPTALSFAIAKRLVEAQGGELRMVDSGTGAEILFPKGPEDGA